MAQKPIHDIETENLERMQREFRMKYEQKIQQLTNVFKQCMEDLKQDYELHV
jgi:hypothetical protein